MKQSKDQTKTDAQQLDQSVYDADTEELDLDNVETSIYRKNERIVDELLGLWSMDSET